MTERYPSEPGQEPREPAGRQSAEAGGEDIDMSIVEEAPSGRTYDDPPLAQASTQSVVGFRVIYDGPVRPPIAKSLIRPGVVSESRWDKQVRQYEEYMRRLREQLDES